MQGCQWGFLATGTEVTWHMSQKGLSESKTQILNTLRQDLTAVATLSSLPQFYLSWQSWGKQQKWSSNSCNKASRDVSLKCICHHSSLFFSLVYYLFRSPLCSNEIKCFLTLFRAAGICLLLFSQLPENESWGFTGKQVIFIKIVSWV